MNCVKGEIREGTGQGGANLTVRALMLKEIDGELTKLGRVLYRLSILRQAMKRDLALRINLNDSAGAHDART